MRSLDASKSLSCFTFVSLSWSKLVSICWWIQTVCCNAEQLNCYRQQSCDVYYFLCLRVDNNRQQLSGWQSLKAAPSLTLWHQNPRPFISISTTNKQQVPGLGGMNMLMPMAATEREFLLISGKSHRLRSSANSLERWNDEQREIDRWNKTVSGWEKALQSKCKRKHEWLSSSWWGDREICRKKKGITGEYETRKDRQHSENQFICSLVGWHWLRPAFFPWPHCQSSQTGISICISS